MKPSFAHPTSSIDCSLSGVPRRLLAIGFSRPRAAWLKRHAVELGLRIGCQVVLLLLQEQHEGDTQLGYPCSASDSSRDGVLEYHISRQQAAGMVEHLSHTVKRIEFILTDSEELKEILSETAIQPVFRIEAATPQAGGSPMSENPPISRIRSIGTTVALGALTVAMYAVVFWKADLVMRLFTKGGAYAALPIATVFGFSFAHGAFASRLWSLLGIQARPKTEAYQNVQPGARPVKTKTKRPRAYAHVNPFHNIDLKGK